MVHSPEAVGLAAARHRLYLTGHTHGGQVCLRGGRAFAYGFKKPSSFDRGLWRYDDMLGYTSRGVGACVVPFRSHCPGEVMVMTLKRGAASVIRDPADDNQRRSISPTF